MIFYSADLHLDHLNILKHTERPYKTLAEMNETLIDNWNSKVSPGDTVYHVGDFAWARADYFLARLQGNIVFIPGNHDKAIMQGKQSQKHVTRSHIHSITVKPHHVYPLEGVNSGAPPIEDSQHIVLCHYAMRSWDRSHYGSWCLYGHSHGRKPPLGKSYDVGVDNNNYFPISHLELKEIMDALPLERIEPAMEELSGFHGY